MNYSLLHFSLYLQNLLADKSWFGLVRKDELFPELSRRFFLESSHSPCSDGNIPSFQESRE